MLTATVGGLKKRKFKNQYQKMYAAMKKDLQDFIDKDTSLSEEIAFYDEFAAKY